ncbi:MAG TPA: iron-containing redox enzyme family protein [Nitrososphaeraceae archaeon]|nr:iron-containing redox enzyme family protein [Nitrososphaeraceae archaeon]
MNTLVERIDLEIEKFSLLKHSFYKMWSDGKLSLDNLRSYSKEYFQLVKAVPDFVQNIISSSSSSYVLNKAISQGLDQNLREELEHVEPWIRFAHAIGVPRNELINHIAADKTDATISVLSHLTKLSIEEAAAAMYAYEKQLPKISRSKIDGLQKFYGMENNADATNYFEIHEETDVRHAELWRSIIKHTNQEKEQAVFNAAIISLQAQNKLLDSVQEKYLSACN